MTDTQRDKRLSDASSLQRSLAALHKVPHEERLDFFHDRVISAIDDVITRHKGSKTTGHFTNQQISVLKDVVFQAIFIVEPMNRTQTGFFSKLKTEWKDTSAMKQVGIAVGLIGFISTTLVGGYHEGVSTVKFLRSISITQKGDDGTAAEKAKQLPAASTPFPGAKLEH